MPSKSTIRNIEILQNLSRGAKEDVRDRVNQVVDFFLETGRFHKLKQQKI